MQPPSPTPIPPSDAPQSDGTAQSSGDAAIPRQVRSDTVRLRALGAGAVAALVSWLLIEATLDSFKPRGTATRFMASTFMIAGSQERATAATRNAALALGLMGATVGLALGLAGAWPPHSLRAALAAVLGLV